MALEFKNVQSSSFADSNSLFNTAAKLIDSGVSTVQDSLQGLADNAKAEQTKVFEKNFTDFAIQMGKVNSVEQAAAIKEQYKDMDFTSMFGANATKAFSLVNTLDTTVKQKQFEEIENNLKLETQQGKVLDSKEKSELDRASILKAQGHLAEANKIANNLSGNAAIKFRQDLAKEISAKKDAILLTDIEKYTEEAMATGTFGNSIDKLKAIGDNKDVSPEVRVKALKAATSLRVQDRTLSATEEASMAQGLKIFDNQAAPITQEAAKVNTTVASLSAERSKLQNAPIVTKDSLELFNSIADTIEIDVGERGDVLTKILDAARRKGFSSAEKTGRNFNAEDFNNIFFLANNEAEKGFWKNDDAIDTIMDSYIARDIKQANELKLASERQLELNNKINNIELAKAGFTSDFLSNIQNDRGQTFTALNIQDNPSYNRYFKEISSIVSPKLDKPTPEENVNVGGNTETPPPEENNNTSGETTEPANSLDALEKEAKLAKSKQDVGKPFGVPKITSIKDVYTIIDDSKFEEAYRQLSLIGEEDLLLNPLADAFNAVGKNIANESSFLTKNFINTPSVKEIKDSIKDRISKRNALPNLVDDISNVFRSRRSVLTDEASRDSEATFIRSKLKKVNKGSIDEILRALGINPDLR